MTRNCKFCNQTSAVLEFIGGKHFVMCRSVECGGPKGFRPLSIGHDTGEEAWKAALTEGTAK